MTNKEFFAEFPVIGSDFQYVSFDAVEIDSQDDIYQLILNFFGLNEAGDVDSGLYLVTGATGSLDSLVNRINLIIESEVFPVQYMIEGNIIDIEHNIIRTIDWNELTALSLFDLEKEKKTLH